MSVQKFLSIYPVGVEIFHWISENIDLLVHYMKCEGINRVSTKFHSNPSNSCYSSDFSLDKWWTI